MLAAAASALLFAGWARASEAPRRLPAQLWLDLRAEAEPEGLATLGLSGAAYLATRPNDNAVKEDVLTTRPIGHDAAAAATWGGNGLVIAPLAAALYAGGRYWGREWAADFGEQGLEALALDAAQSELLKDTVRRERPDGSDHASFPSGHAGASFALATVAAGRGGWLAGVPSFLAASLIGYSRLELNKHHLSDVIFGAGMGVACGRSVLRAHARARDSRAAFAPWIGPGAAGLAVSF